MSLDEANQMEDAICQWAADLITRTYGASDGDGSEEAVQILLKASSSAGRMKGGVQTLAMALLRLAPRERLKVISEIQKVSPGLMNRIMTEIKGKTGMAIRHDILANMVLRAHHLALYDIISSARMERVRLAMDIALKEEQS